MAQVTEVRVGHGVTARLLIEQDGPHHCPQVTPRSTGLTVEDLGDARDVPRRRVACYEMLDELLGDERTDVRMIEDVVDCPVQILLSRLTRGELDAVEKRLGQRVVLRGVDDHWIDVVGHAGGRPRRKAPAREHACEIVDRLLRIRGDGLAGCVELRRAVAVHTHGADREELQNLARVVLVGPRARVAIHVEVAAHRRVHGEFEQQLAEVAERVTVEELQVRRHPAWLCNVHARHDENLMECERDALPNLILAVERVHEESVLQRVHRVVVALTGRSSRTRHRVASRWVER